MWFQLFLIAVFFAANVGLYMQSKNGGRKHKLKEGSTAVLTPVLIQDQSFINDQAIKADTIFPDTLQTLQLVLSLILSTRKVPNYEFLTNWIKATERHLTIIHLPAKKWAMANIADLDIAKSIMKSSAWANRLPDGHYFYSCQFGKPLGLLFGNDQWWKESRKLTMKLLHQLDFFRLENMEQFISYEINQVKTSVDEKIRENGGEEATIRVHQMFEIHTLNIVYQVIMGKRFETDDPIAQKIISTMNAANRDFNLGTSVLELFPWLSHVPGLQTYMSTSTKASQTCYDYFQNEVIDKRRKTGTYKTEPKDFADYFLLEIDKNAAKEPSYLTEENLLVVLRDMVFAGSDTSNSVMEHGILHTALRPEVQRKVQDEIDQVIGYNRSPSYDDRHKMPYTQAVLLEVMRYATPVPVTARSPLEDNEINGNFVPKGSFCMINIYAIHRSEDIWEDPYVFRPERFLNEKNEIVNTDKFIPFGFGKRLCVGESVARITLFIFFVTLMQRFSFEISDKHPPPSFKNLFGLSRCPMPYHVKVKSRVPA